MSMANSSKLLKQLIKEVVQNALKEIDNKTTQNTALIPPQELSPMSTPAQGSGSESPEDSLTFAKTQQGFVSKSEKEAMRQAAWEEIEELRQHLEDLRKKDAERLANKPNVPTAKKQKVVALPPLPANLTTDFIQRVGKITDYLHKSNMPPEARMAVDNQVYNIVADESKTESEKLKAIKKAIGERLNLLYKAKMHLTNLNENTINEILTVS